MDRVRSELLRHLSLMAILLAIAVPIALFITFIASALNKVIGTM